MGGFQKTSIILGALGGCILTLNFFKIMKLEMLADATDLVRLPDRLVLEITEDKELFQWIILFEKRN